MCIRDRVGTAGETLGAADAGERGSAQSRAGEVVGGEESAAGGATRGGGVCEASEGVKSAGRAAEARRALNFISSAAMLGHRGRCCEENILSSSGGTSRLFRMGSR